jgi:hypothetical protein
MTHPAGHAELTDSLVLHDAISLHPEIQEASDEIDRERRLQRSIADALKNAGVFRHGHALYVGRSRT